MRPCLFILKILLGNKRRKLKESDRSHFTAATFLHLFSACFLNQLLLLHCSCHRGSHSAAVRVCHSERINRCLEKGSRFYSPLMQKRNQTSIMRFSVHDGVFFHPSHTLRPTVCASLGSNTQSLELCQSEFSWNKSRKSLRELARGSAKVTAVNY